MLRQADRVTYRQMNIKMDAMTNKEKIVVDNIEYLNI